MNLKVTLYGPYGDDAVVFPALMPLVLALHPAKAVEIIGDLGRSFIDRACEPGGIEYPTTTDTVLLADGVVACLDALTEDAAEGPAFEGFEVITFLDEDGFEIGTYRA